MTQLIKPQKPKLEVADIVRKHIRDYQNTYPLWPDQHRILSHLLNCCTAKLGGHIDRCNHCGAERIIYLFLPQSTLPQVPANTPRAVA